jgi:two-component system response regulator PilR (NtrC family)
MSGLDVVRAAKDWNRAAALIMMTGDPSVDTAIEALKLGADDYLTKPLRPDVLRHCLGRAVEQGFLRREVTALRRRLGEDLGTRELIGVSLQIDGIRKIMTTVAASSATVLIEGESGTGKELIAAGIHRQSPRGDKPLISVNCGAIPRDLVESELFGHVRGAFSGAVADSVGLFRAADGGTLFLDEVTELPTSLQTKLLRVLQEGEVRPVGSAKTVRVDVRIIAATNRPVDEAVRQGSLRQDLFYRLNVVRIVVPPLRERPEDIPVLARHFLRGLAQRLGRDLTEIAADALAALLGYGFPGNVRELENLLERACALGARGTIGLSDLPALSASGSRLPALPPAPPDVAPEGLPTVAQVERELILRALALYPQDKSRAARAIGLPRRTFYRRLREYGLLG